MQENDKTELLNPDDEIVRLRQELKAKELELKRATMARDAYERMIVIAEEKYAIPIRKTQAAKALHATKDIVEGNALTKRRSVPLTIAHRAVYHHGPSAAVLSASFIYRGAREATVRRGRPASRCTAKKRVEGRRRGGNGEG